MKRYIKSAVADVSDEDMDSRKEIAKSTTANVAMLEKLSRDSDRRIREQIAKNPNTPIDVLEQLSTDKSYLVRMQIARNPNTPASLLSQMVKNEKTFYEGKKYRNLEVFWELLKNENTPLEDRITIAKDEYSMKYASDVKEFLARKKSTPTEILEAIASGYYDILYAELATLLAKNPNTPTKILRVLAKHWYSAELIKNPSTPPDILHKIFLDNLHNENFTTCKSILKNPNLSSKLRKQMEAELAEKSGSYKQKYSLKQYVGKDIWLTAIYCGISHDYDAFVRLISSKGKNEYSVNLIVTHFFHGTQEEFTHALVQDEIYQVAIYDSENSEDAEVLIDRNYKTYTTEELQRYLCGEYED